SHLCNLLRLSEEAFSIRPLPLAILKLLCQLNLLQELNYSRVFAQLSEARIRIDFCNWEIVVLSSFLQDRDRLFFVAKQSIKVSRFFRQKHVLLRRLIQLIRYLQRLIFLAYKGVCLCESVGDLGIIRICRMSLFQFSNRLGIFLLQFIDLGDVSRHRTKVRLNLEGLPALFERFVVSA